MNLAEAHAILRSCTGDFCRIEVTPSNIILDQSNEIPIHSSTNRTVLNENNRQTFYRTPSNNPIPPNHHNWIMRTSYQNIPKKTMNKTRHNSISKREQKEKICLNWNYSNPKPTCIHISIDLN